MHNRLLLSFAALVLLCIGFWLQADWMLNRPVNRVNYERIRLAMPLKQVEAILGKEKAPYSSDKPPDWVRQAEGVPVSSANGYSIHAWNNDTHSITVLMDSQDRVIGKSFLCAPYANAARRYFDLLPFWSIILAAVLGLLILIYLCLVWAKKPWWPVSAERASLVTPAFLGLDDE